VTTRPRGAHGLDDLVGLAATLAGVRRTDLAPGDRLLVATRNSVYTLTLLEDGRFLVGGGRFQREGLPAVVRAVTGCSAGGSALFTRLVAAPGLFLELDDGTRTTRIRRVRLLAAAAGESRPS
jgi:hypothetical protein